MKAVESKNKAEQDLIQLREHLREKMLQEQKYQYALLTALNKNEPKLQKQIKIDSLYSNVLASTKNNDNPINYLRSVNNGSFQSNFQVRGPLKIYEKGGITANSDVFKEAQGDKTLICETKMVPMEALDQFVNGKYKLICL